MADGLSEPALAAVVACKQRAQIGQPYAVKRHQRAGLLAPCQPYAGGQKVCAPWLVALDAEQLTPPLHVPVP